MKPFHDDYNIQIINKYNAKISAIESGEYRVIKARIHEDTIKGYLYKIDGSLDIEVCELVHNNSSIMKLDIREVQGSYETIKYARGKVGVVGLGLGYTVQEIAKKDEVSEVVVYESSEEIVKIYEQNFGEDKKIKIIVGDAYTATPDIFDFFFVDIYGYEISDKVVDDYIKFNQIHQIEEYAFWGLEHFLLSCRYEEIIWVFIPEVWMAMSKDIFSSLDSAGYMDYYKQLDEELVSNILDKFKKVLNEE